jgi:transposase
MTKQKQYSAEWKTQVILEILKGQKSLAEICREHEVADDLVCHWRNMFLERAPQVFIDPRTNGKEASENQRIADLERMVGRLTMDLDAAKKALRLLPSRSSNAERSYDGWQQSFQCSACVRSQGLSRTTFYYQAQEDEALDLREVIEQVEREYLAMDRDGSLPNCSDVARRSTASKSSTSCAKKTCSFRCGGSAKARTTQVSGSITTGVLINGKVPNPREAAPSCITTH